MLDQVELLILSFIKRPHISFQQIRYLVPHVLCELIFSVLSLMCVVFGGKLSGAVPSLLIIYRCSLSLTFCLLGHPPTLASLVCRSTFLSPPTHTYIRSHTEAGVTVRFKIYNEFKGIQNHYAVQNLCTLAPMKHKK